MSRRTPRGLPNWSPILRQDQGRVQDAEQGQDPGKPNCFWFPLSDGGLQVYRFSPGTKEAATWDQSGYLDALASSTCWPRWTKPPLPLTETNKPMAAHQFVKVQHGLQALKAIGIEAHCAGLGEPNARWTFHRSEEGPQTGCQHRLQRRR